MICLTKFYFFRNSGHIWRIIHENVRNREGISVLTKYLSKSLNYLSYPPKTPKNGKKSPK